jgi:SAM-dependent methyltransferase
LITKGRPMPPPERPAPRPEPPAPPAIACNICGGVTFKPGPNNRLVNGNIAPVCEVCGSFERHRAIRQIFERVRTRRFAELEALQFGRDRGIAGGWFRSFKRASDDAKDPKSVHLSLDWIALPDAAMDVVICNFMLETLPDYRTALREIGRVVSDYGFAFVAVQSPNLRVVTQELSPALGDRRRTFGQDFEPELAALLPDLHVIRTVGIDPITEVEAWGYFITMDDDFAGFLFERGLRAKFVNIRKIMA